MILLVTRKLSRVNSILKTIMEEAREIVLVDDGVYNALENEELMKTVSCREKVIVDAGDLETRGLEFKELAENVRLSLNAYKLVAERILDGELIVAV